MLVETSHDGNHMTPLNDCLDIRNALVPLASQDTKTSTVMPALAMTLKSHLTSLNNHVDTKNVTVSSMVLSASYDTMMSIKSQVTPLSNCATEIQQCHSRHCYCHLSVMSELPLT